MLGLFLNLSNCSLCGFCRVVLFIFMRNLLWQQNTVCSIFLKYQQFFYCLQTIGRYMTMLSGYLSVCPLLITVYLAVSSLFTVCLCMCQSMVKPGLCHILGTVQCPITGVEFMVSMVEKCDITKVWLYLFVWLLKFCTEWEVIIHCVPCRLYVSVIIRLYGLIQSMLINGYL